MDPEALSAVQVARECLRSLIRKHSLLHGDFVLSSGARSTYYLDLRKTTMRPEAMAFIGDLCIDMIAALQWHTNANPVNSVGGMTMGADPVACAIAMSAWSHRLSWRAFSVRKEPKDHGTGKQVEGAFELNDRVIIVEDTVTSGATAVRAVRAIKEAGGTVVGAIAVVDRDEGGREALRDEGVPLASLFHVDSILRG